MLGLWGTETEGRREIEGELKKEDWKREINRELKRKMDLNEENESKKWRIWEREKTPNNGILLKNERTEKEKNGKH